MTRSLDEELIDLRVGEFGRGGPRAIDPREFTVLQPPGARRIVDLRHDPVVERAPRPALLICGHARRMIHLIVDTTRESNVGLAGLAVDGMGEFGNVSRLLDESRERRHRRERCEPERDRPDRRLCGRPSGE